MLSVKQNVKGLNVARRFRLIELSTKTSDERFYEERYSDFSHVSTGLTLMEKGDQEDTG